MLRVFVRILNKSSVCGGIYFAVRNNHHVPAMQPNPAALIRRTAMSRIATVDPNTATGDARRLLDAVHSQLGAVPNFIRVLANSPKALEAFLGLYDAAAAFSLDQATQERIALSVAESNSCQYCVSAHAAIGRRAGLSNEEWEAPELHQSWKRSYKNHHLHEWRQDHYSLHPLQDFYTYRFFDRLPIRLKPVVHLHSCKW